MGSPLDPSVHAAPGPQALAMQQDSFTSTHPTSTLIRQMWLLPCQSLQHEQKLGWSLGRAPCTCQSLVPPSLASHPPQLDHTLASQCSPAPRFSPQSHPPAVSREVLPRPNLTAPHPPKLLHGCPLFWYPRDCRTFMQAPITHIDPDVAPGSPPGGCAHHTAHFYMCWAPPLCPTAFMR